MSLSAKARFRIFIRDNFTCQYCGRQAPDVELHVDHREPRSRGGTDDPSNLVTACVECNLGKGNERTTLAFPSLCFLCIDEGRERVLYHSYREHDFRGVFHDILRALEKDYVPEECDQYMAHYVCDFGHRWFTSYKLHERATTPEIVELAAQMGWRIRA